MDAKETCENDAAGFGYAGRLAHIGCPEVAAILKDLMLKKNDNCGPRNTICTYRSWIGLQLTNEFLSTEIGGWDWYENGQKASCLRKGEDLNVKISLNTEFGSGKVGSIELLGEFASHLELKATRENEQYTHICEFRSEFLFQYYGGTYFKNSRTEPLKNKYSNKQYTFLLCFFYFLHYIILFLFYHAMFQAVYFSKHSPTEQQLQLYVRKGRPDN